MNTRNTLTRGQALDLIDAEMSDLGRTDTGYEGLMALAQHWQARNPTTSLGIAIGAAEDEDPEDEDEATAQALANALREHVDSQCATHRPPNDNEDTGLTAPDDEDLAALPDPLVQAIDNASAWLREHGMTPLTDEQVACLKDPEREVEAQGMLHDLQDRCGLPLTLAIEVAREAWVDQSELHEPEESPYYDVLINRIQRAIETDDDCQDDRLVQTYKAADPAARRVVDDCMICICGYSLATMIRECEPVPAQETPAVSDAAVTELDDALTVEAALDAAVLVIQNKLCQTAGDFAGRYFSGGSEDAVRTGLLAYLKAEREDMAWRKREAATAPLPPTIATDTANLMDAAMCAWEEVLDIMRLTGAEGRWNKYRNLNGMAALRDRIMELVPLIEADYRACVAKGYDDAFDWEFVPNWLAIALDDDLVLIRGIDRVALLSDAVEEGRAAGRAENSDGENRLRLMESGL